MRSDPQDGPEVFVVAVRKVALKIACVEVFVKAGFRYCFDVAVVFLAYKNRG